MPSVACSWNWKYFNYLTSSSNNFSNTPYLQNALRADAMLLAELLPELESDLVVATFREVAILESCFRQKVPMLPHRKVVFGKSPNPHLIATLPQLEHHHLTRHVASLFWIWGSHKRYRKEIEKHTSIKLLIVIVKFKKSSCLVGQSEWILQL